MKIYLESLGCCRNQIDSEVMLGRLEAAGHEIGVDPAEAEVIVINTCGFIASASAEAVDTILELAQYKSEGACRRLVVTGCLPERFRDDTIAEALPEVDAFLGTGACDQIVRAVEGGSGAAGVEINSSASSASSASSTASDSPSSIISGSTASPMMLLPDPCDREFQGFPLPRRLTLGYSAYVKISEGCNRRCTYCIIPQLRGRQRSRSIEDITSEVSHLIRSGVKEIILVGENTTDYGVDLKNTASGKKIVISGSGSASSSSSAAAAAGGSHLAQLLEKVSQCADKYASDQPVWLRLLYTHPSSITDEVIEKVASLHNFCTYFDIPVQHASSKILKLMGRDYDLGHLYRLFESIRDKAPDATLRTTLITGFPGETEADFRTMVKFVEDIRFDHLGVFAYSDSEDLPSHNLKGHIAEELKEERHDIIMAAQSAISEKINEKYMDQTLTVLIEENPDEGIYLGRTAFQAPEVDGITFIYGSGLEIGAFADVKITETHEYDLAGEHSSYDPSFESREARSSSPRRQPEE